MENVESICEKNLNDFVLIVGDFNLLNFILNNGTMKSYNSKSVQLLQTINLCNLQQQSSVFNYSGVMLDLVLSNMIVTVSEVDVNNVLTPIDFLYPALTVEFLIDICD